MLAPPELSPDYWRQILPMIEKIEPGGVALLAIEPLRTENQPRLTIGIFTAAERAALKKALQKAKKQRETP